MRVPLQSVGAFVLDVDPDLGGKLDPTEWEAVRTACRGELLHVPRGPWSSAPEAPDRDDLVAFVIVDGLLARELSLGHGCIVELLGHGDVVQPPIVTEPPRLGTETRLTAVSDLVLLVLGQSFACAAARWPTLLATLHHRLEAERESLAIQGLIAQLPNAKHRLLLTLWRLAERWGYVTPQGTVFPWPLNHEILARLTGARRPTITLALRDLEASGAVHRREDRSWVLTATAERMINAMARPRRFTVSIGERLALYQQVIQTTAKTRARQAEARQIISQRSAPTTTEFQNPPAPRREAGRLSQTKPVAVKPGSVEPLSESTR